MTTQPWPGAIHMLRLQLTHGADPRTVRNVLEALPLLVPDTEDEHETLTDWLARFGEGVPL